MNDISDIEWASMSDKAIAEAIGKFVGHHRLNQNKTQAEVASAAGISRSTLSLLERGETVGLPMLIRVLRVLDLLNVMDGFRVNDEISPIEYAKLKKNKRKRARSKTEDETTKDELSW